MGAGISIAGDDNRSNPGESIVAEILDELPPRIRRPLGLIGDAAYAIAWIPASATVREVELRNGTRRSLEVPRKVSAEIPAVLRSDGAVFADPAELTVEDGIARLQLRGARPPQEVGLDVSWPDKPPPEGLWSGAGVRRFVAGQRPDPADVFGRVVDVVDHFVSFERSLAPQRVMCELMACYILGTYLLDAFDVAGYVWVTGPSGSGKTTLLHVVAELGYLGTLLLARSSYATLRDLADAGATLAFDDIEGLLDPRTGDPDKRALALAGNHRGAVVAVKEPVGAHGWRTRLVNAYCPRLFSAIRLPDAVLASRSIIIPLVRSADSARATRSPGDHASWPHDRRRLIDDLWALALTYLPSLREYYGAVPTRTSLIGRPLEPWRGILAVALFLQERAGVEGVFDRLEALARNYQDEPVTVEEDDPVRLLVEVLCQDAVFADRAEWIVEPGELAQRINQRAAEEGLMEGAAPFINAKRVGRLLQRLRFERAPRTARAKRWRIRREDVAWLAQVYHVPYPLANGTCGTNGKTTQADSSSPPGTADPSPGDLPSDGEVDAPITGASSVQPMEGFGKTVDADATGTAGLRSRTEEFEEGEL